MDYDARRYVNCLAELLCIVSKFQLPINQLSSLQGYEETADETKALMDRAWRSGEKAFFDALDGLTTSLKSSQEDSRFAAAAAAAIWMDNHIAYQQHPGERYVSLYDLVPLSGKKPVFVDQLNTNDRETGIQLHPKFEVCKIFNQQTSKYEPFANRDVFDGLNGQLNAVGYVPYNEKTAVHHVVLPNDCRKRNPDGILRVAFCPMTDNPKILSLDKRTVERQGIPMQGRGVEAVTDPEQILARFREAYLLACRRRVDILVFPEMLGLEALEEAQANTNLAVMDLLPEVEALSEELGEELRPPMLVFLPTWWRDGINSTTVVYEDGKILGSQKKYIPYVNTKENWVEALREEDARHILMIHLPGVHRIAAVICAEFQPLRDHLAKVLCGGLGATLILVQSYTKGEQDFLNSLSTLKDYGTTVVWGNCCGAAKAPRVIGGCSIAGLDRIHRFSDCCTGGDACEKCGTCLYLVKLPLGLSRAKPREPSWDDPVDHQLLA